MMLGWSHPNVRLRVPAVGVYFRPRPQVSSSSSLHSPREPRTEVDCKMERPAGQAHLNLTIGALLAAGGIFAYVRKGSKASLIGDGGSGGLLLGSGLLASRYPRSSFTVGALVSLLLALGMVPRAVKAKKMMPGGLR